MHAPTLEGVMHAPTLVMLYFQIGSVCRLLLYVGSETIEDSVFQNGGT